MCSILVPVDGSENSDRALRLVISLYQRLAPMDVHLLHVYVPVVTAVEEADSQKSVDQDIAAVGKAALRSARTLLEAAGISYSCKVLPGYVASSIVGYANDNRCDGIIMGTRGMGSTEELLGSIARQVVHLARVPVTLVK